MENEMAETYNPSDYTVDEVNAYLADNPDQRDAVLAAEAEGKNRTGIVGESTTGGAQTVQEAGEAQPETVGEKYEKGYEGYAPSRDGDNPVDLTLAGVTGQNKDA